MVILEDIEMKINYKVNDYNNEHNQQGICECLNHILEILS